MYCENFYARNFEVRRQDGTTAFSDGQSLVGSHFFGQSSFAQYTNVQVNGVVKVPGHPVTTLLFIAICWAVAINTVYRYPGNTLIGMAIMLAGLPAYWFWRSRRAIE